MDPLALLFRGLLINRSGFHRVLGHHEEQQLALRILLLRAAVPDNNDRIDTYRCDRGTQTTRPNVMYVHGVSGATTHTNGLLLVDGRVERVAAGQLAYTEDATRQADTRYARGGSG